MRSCGGATTQPVNSAEPRTGTIINARIGFLLISRRGPGAAELLRRPDTRELPVVVVQATQPVLPAVLAPFHVAVPHPVLVHAAVSGAWVLHGRNRVCRRRDQGGPLPGISGGTRRQQAHYSKRLSEHHG
jgi:hypothetical protein